MIHLEKYNEMAEWGRLDTIPAVSSVYMGVGVWLVLSFCRTVRLAYDYLPVGLFVIIPATSHLLMYYSVSSIGPVVTMI